MTAALKGGEWSAARPGRTLPPGKTRYLLDRRMGGPQRRSGREENLVPTGIRSRTVQHVVSRYTDWATRPTVNICVTGKILNVISIEFPPPQKKAGKTSLCFVHFLTYRKWMVHKFWWKNIYEIFILIIAQRDAKQSSLYIILQVHSTCFGCQPHPSSEYTKL